MLSEGTGSSSGGSSSGGGSSSSGGCEDACEPGATRCVDDVGVAGCVEAEGCWRWAETEICPEGQVCSASACAAPAGFRGVSTAWPVPKGGRAGEGFAAGAGEAGAVGDDVWRLIDLDGDGALDLVVTATASKVGEAFVTRTQGFPQAPFWEIYRGGAGGFAGPPTAWMLPVGVGLLERGVVSLDNASATFGDHTWALRDLTSDGRPDLIVTGQGDFDDVVLPLGAEDAAPRWDVYVNQGGRFAAEPTAVELPPGPDALRLTAPEGTIAGEGGVRWTLADVSGDGRNDLVFLARDAGAGLVVPGFPDAPHWEVHLGWGKGFQPEPLAWSVPPGGLVGAGFVALESGGAAEGDEVWTLVDLDGDLRREILVTGAWDQTGPLVFDPEGEPHWRIYRITSGGFDPTFEPLPVPGEGGGAHGRGFHSPRGGQEVAGTLDHPFDLQGWELLDLNGDRRLDLVITNEARVQDKSYSRRALGGAEDPRWEVHFGGAAGFASARPWPMPTGGLAGRGYLWSRGPAEPVPQVTGTVLWELGDLDGDRKPDLILTAEGVARDGGSNWSWRVFDADAPHWRVYRYTP